MQGTDEVLAAIASGKQQMLEAVSAESTEVNQKLAAQEAAIASLKEQITLFATGQAVTEDLTSLVEAVDAAFVEARAAISNIFVAAAESVEETPPPEVVAEVTDEELDDELE